MLRMVLYTIKKIEAEGLEILKEEVDIDDRTKSEIKFRNKPRAAEQCRRESADYLR